MLPDVYNYVDGAYSSLDVRGHDVTYDTYEDTLELLHGILFTAITIFAIHGTTYTVGI